MVSLPEIKQQTIIPEYFPTVMQAVIFRNWGMVPVEKLAEVLSCSVSQVEEEAYRMGLSPQEDVSLWADKGYITVIRANWHLLPYDQLLKLLGWTEEQLSITLKEEDFLDIKLGNFKPECEPVCYCPLTDAQKAQTETIKKVLEAYLSSENTKAPFDFFTDTEEKPVKKAPFDGCVTVDGNWCLENLTQDSVVDLMAEDFLGEVKSVWDVSLAKQSHKSISLSYLSGKKAEYHEILVTSDKIEIRAADSAGILRGLNRLLDLAMKAGGLYFTPGHFVREPRFGVRYIYSFCGLYQTAFDVDSATYCPDGLLKMYAKTGVNGIWLQGVLYRLTKFPFAPEISDGWEMRLKNLQNFAKRAARYGIKIYLYLNEPRTMPLSFFDNYPELKGAESGRYATMCTSSPKTREYLSNAVEYLCKAVPELGGFFTITMSENLTHCKARPGEITKPCERCKDRKPWELVLDFNTILEEAAHRVNPDIVTIAWDWAWSPNYGISDEDLQHAIEGLPKTVALQCKRETKIPFVRGGVKGEVDDYALSVEGVSEESLKRWSIAKQSGHPICAKLQINNSWECSTTPYMPVYEILINQMNSMIEANVDHLMLSWTLGGYPSPSIRLISEAFFIENGNTKPDYYSALEVLYGEHAPVVKEATDLFCKAFREFPFHIEVLYQGPQNAGVSNPLYSKPTGYTATMTCYAYDDLKNWCGNFPEEILEQQFKKVSDIWAEGLSKLDTMGECELKDISYVSYSLFLSSYHQIHFIRLRDMFHKEPSPELLTEIRQTIAAERDLAVKVYEIMQRRPEVGFEAANHYYYSLDTVKEKIVNCEYLLDYFK